MLHHDDVSNCACQLTQRISGHTHVKKRTMSLKIPHMSHLYQRLGMGLSVSPAIWQNFIQRVLQEIPDYRKNYLAIMDDILTHSNREDHTGYLIDL